MAFLLSSSVVVVNCALESPGITDTWRTFCSGCCFDRCLISACAATLINRPKAKATRRHIVWAIYTLGLQHIFGYEIFKNVKSNVFICICVYLYFQKQRFQFVHELPNDHTVLLTPAPNKSAISIYNNSIAMLRTRGEGQLHY